MSEQIVNDARALAKLADATADQIEAGAEYARLVEMAGELIHVASSIARAIANAGKDTTA